MNQTAESAWKISYFIGMQDVHAERHGAVDAAKAASSSRSVEKFLVSGRQSYLSIVGMVNLKKDCRLQTE